jgi:hypothetical protein
VGAVVLGWFGSTLRRIRRHAELLSGEGIDTLAVVPSMSSTAFPVVARALSRRIARECTVGPLADKRKLLFLLLSGCGENVFHHLLVDAKDNAAGRSSAVVARIAGVAYDSAPVSADPAIWSRAFTAATFGRLCSGRKPSPSSSSSSSSSCVGAVPVYDAKLVTPVARVLSQAHLRLPWNAAWVRRAGGAVDECLPRRVPALFQYSDADSLVPGAYISAFAEDQKRGGRPTVVAKFAGSEHVNHLRAHPDAYLRAIRDFTLFCDL